MRVTEEAGEVFDADGKGKDEEKHNLNETFYSNRCRCSCNSSCSFCC